MKYFFKNFLLIAILSFAVSPSFSQVITTGPEQTITYDFKGVFPVGENSFFVQHYDKMSGTKMILTHYTNFVKDATTGPLTSEDCSVLVIDGKLIVFQNVEKKGVVTMTAQEYGADCKPVGEAKVMMSYKIVSGTIPRESVNGSVVQSENGEYFATIFRVFHKNKIQYGFNIYNKSLVSIREGFVNIPYESYDLSDIDKLLSDQGNLYFSCYNKEGKGWSRDKKIWKLENNELKQLAIKLGGISLMDPTIYETKEGTLHFVGVGYEYSQTALELMFGQIDFNDGTVELENRIDLEMQFIGFYDLPSKYKIPEIVIHENGNMGLVIDQYSAYIDWVQSNGVSSPVHRIVYYDTKVLMLDNNRDILWTANLGHANQVSYFGEYSKTFCLDVKPDQYIFYMNLNKTRSGTENPQMFTISEDKQAEQDNCLGMISVNLETGETQRKFLCDQADCNWLSTFTLDNTYNNGIILAFHKGLMKYRFGLIK